MKLTEQDADLYYCLMWLLQKFANEELGIIQNITTLDEYNNLEQSDKRQVREALFENPNLIEQYVSKNPDGLNQDALLIISKWTDHISGNFYVERYLKNHAIFIGNEQVYGVLALHDSFEELFLKYCLPLYAQAILLPFKGQIIYDGILQTYNLIIGGGIKRQLKEAYMRAKQNGRLVLALDNQEKIKEDKQQAYNDKYWSKELNQLGLVSKKLKGGEDQPEVNGLVFSLVKKSVELANEAVLNSDDKFTLKRDIKKVKSSLNKLERYLLRMD